MKLRYIILIATIFVFVVSIPVFLSVFDIETTQSRGKDFCNSNDMSFELRSFVFKKTEFYCTGILDNSFLEKEIKLSGETWGFA